MHIELGQVAPENRYKLLSGLVTPRPIALITTRSPSGRINAAPYSFFNVVSHDPPLTVVGFDEREPGLPKDTVRNIRATRRYVINLVDYALAERMAVCAQRFPYETDELAEAGLTGVEGSSPAFLRIAEAPASLECSLKQDLEFGDKGQRTLLIGEISHVHVRDGIVNERFHVDAQALDTIGRLAGNEYARITDRFRVTSTI